MSVPDLGSILQVEDFVRLTPVFMSGVCFTIITGGATDVRRE
jgi:hypothetical protein